MDESGQKAQTSRYKIRVDLKSSNYKKKNLQLCASMDVNSSRLIGVNILQHIPKLNQYVVQLKPMLYGH